MGGKRGKGRGAAQQPPGTTDPQNRQGEQPRNPQGNQPEQRSEQRQTSPQSSRGSSERGAPRGRGEYSQARGYHQERGEHHNQGRGEHHTRGRGDYQIQGRGEYQSQGRGYSSGRGDGITSRGDGGRSRGRGDGETSRGRGDWGTSRGRGDGGPSRGRGEQRGRGRGSDDQVGAWQQHSRGGGRPQGRGYSQPRGDHRGSRGDERGRGRGEYRGNEERPGTSRQQQSAETQQKVVKKVEVVCDDTVDIQEKGNNPGTRGKKFVVSANHFEIKIRATKCFHYDVTIQPDARKKFLKFVFQRFREMHFGGSNPAFDGSKNAYSAGELPFGEEIEGTVTMLDDRERPQEFQVKIKKVAEVDLSLIHNYIRREVTLEGIQRCLQALDVVFRSSPSLNYITVGRSFFSKPRDRIDLGQGMELYQGTFQSVTIGHKPFLNVDIVHKAFPKDDSVISIIRELFRNVDLSRPLQYYQVQKLNDFLKDLKIVYEEHNNPASKRTQRVHSVEDTARIEEFPLENGTIITIENYYATMKNLKLQYPNMPTVWVGSRTRPIKIKYPVEFCKVLPDQVTNKELEPNQTTQMIRHCATNTNKRKEAIGRCVKESNFGTDPVVQEFGLEVSANFEKIEARLLVKPNIIYGPQTVRVNKGAWIVNRFYNPAQMDSWQILNLDSYVDNSALNNMSDMIKQVAPTLGLVIGNPQGPCITLQLNRLKEYQILQKLREEFKKFKKEGTAIIFVVIPKNLYENVKGIAELEVGCITQCIKSNTVINKMDRSTVQNILQKVNAKLNGVNHTVDTIPNIFNVPTIIMGADVTHPKPGSIQPSVAAVTASYDTAAFQYRCLCHLQEPREEIICDLETVTKDHLKYFVEMNGKRPQMIIFYRDGVSQGQFKMVLQRELPAIRRACWAIDPTYSPAITFLVVQKRHHTRLFPETQGFSEDRNNNVPAGTCVDTVITMPTMQNFFLTSHASIQGVARPTKYVTLHDDNNFSNDDLQSLTYHLCHLFARCTRSVSYPAPTYYAHLAAARAKAYTKHVTINLDNLPGGDENIQNCVYKDNPMFYV